MKKITTTLLLIIIFALTGGCSEKDSSEDNAKKTDDSSRRRTTVAPKPQASPEINPDDLIQEKPTSRVSHGGGGSRQIITHDGGLITEKHQHDQKCKHCQGNNAVKTAFKFTNNNGTYEFLLDGKDAAGYTCSATSQGEEVELKKVATDVLGNVAKRFFYVVTCTKSNEPSYTFRFIRGFEEDAPPVKGQLKAVDGKKDQNFFNVKKAIVVVDQDGFQNDDQEKGYFNIAEMQLKGKYHASYQLFYQLGGTSYSELDSFSDALRQELFSYTNCPSAEAEIEKSAKLVAKNGRTEKSIPLDIECRSIVSLGDIKKVLFTCDGEKITTEMQFHPYTKLYDKKRSNTPSDAEKKVNIDFHYALEGNFNDKKKEADQKYLVKRVKKDFDGCNNFAATVTSTDPLKRSAFPVYLTKIKIQGDKESGSITLEGEDFLKDIPLEFGDFKFPATE